MRDVPCSGASRLPHRAPLSDEAVALLKALKQQTLHDTVVFPSRRQDYGDKTMLSDMALTKLLRDVNPQSDTDRVATAQGFRSGFCNCASENVYESDLAGGALTHSVKDEPEAAYHRTDLLTQREPMMQAWSAFAFIPKPLQGPQSPDLHISGHTCQTLLGQTLESALPQAPGVVDNWSSDNHTNRSGKQSGGVSELLR